MPGYGSRYWEERTADNRRRSYPKFRGRHTADMVIIGGGLTGATAAYVLAAGGLDVVLLEGERLASGSTAGGVGAIVPEPSSSFRSVEAAVGKRDARNAWADTQKAAVDFAAALEKLPASSDLSASALIVNAARADDAAALRKEQAARRTAGVVAPWANAAAVQTEAGTESAGAIRLTGVSVFDPVRAALAFGGAGEKAGARIFEQSPVRRVTFTRKYADVFLAAGSIRTRGVYVATGEPGALYRQLRRHVRMETAYAVVTEPLSAAMRRESGKRTAVLTEGREDRLWIRWLTEDRVLASGLPSRPVGPRLRDKSVIQRTSELMYQLSLRYPVISGLPARWAWDVPVCSTQDGLPWIGPHRNYPFHFFALAFGWHGDALAWLAARMALRQFRGDTRSEDAAFGFVRHL
jgi:glycine/D-amino acid oxidase-like deaminating enzyme